MVTLVRTDATHDDFIILVRALDEELAIRDGADHAFYAQFNQVSGIRHAVVAYMDERAVACGAFREIDAGIAEIKRMYTLPEARGKGLAGAVLAELERWARESSFHTCRLETGKRQPEAIALYLKSGYHAIANYGQYADVGNSVCFEKSLVNTVEPGTPVS